MADEMSSQERTARIMGLYRELMNTLPTESQTLFLSREEIAAREAAGKNLSSEITELARNARDARQS